MCSSSAIFMFLATTPSCFTLQSKIVRVLNLWQKNGVFKIEVIQPLLDMAAGSSSGAAPFAGTDGPGRFCQVYRFRVLCPVQNEYALLSSAMFGPSAQTLLLLRFGPLRFSATFCQRASYCSNGQLHHSICCSAAEFGRLSCCGPAHPVHAGSAGVCVDGKRCAPWLSLQPL